MSSKFDVVLPFQLENSSIRGRLVRLDEVMWKIIRQHDYPEVVNYYLAQTTALSIALVNCFKFEGLFTLQISGDGPLRLVIVDVNSKGHVRACARYDEERIDSLSKEKQKNIQAVFGAGHMAFTIDPELGEDRYQGVTELIGESLAECTHHFFHQSEQLETGVVLAGVTDEQGLSAAALMIQRLPLPANTPIEERERLDDQWIHSLSLTGSITKKELLNRDLSNEDILHRLYWEEGARLYDPKPYIAQCRCTTERIKQMLSNFGARERKDMVLEDKIVVTCEFCGQEYSFEENDFES